VATKEGAPATAAAIVIGLYPDVCKSPRKCVPYQIVAFHDDATLFSSDVRFTQFAAMNSDSRIGKVFGDGAAKEGVNSRVVEGQCRPVAGTASKVRVNGKPAVRHDTEFEMNCAGPDGPANTKGKTSYAFAPAQGSVDADGNVTAPHAVVPALPNKGVLSSNPNIMMTSANPSFLVRVDEAVAKFGAATEQVEGYVRGIGLEIFESLGGIAQLGFGAARLNYDLMLGGLVDPFAGDSPPAWLPSGARAGETARSGADMAGAIWDNPWLVWDGIKDPYVRAWAEGRYGEALGRGTVGVIDVVAGTKGILKSGKAGLLGRRVLRRLGSADSFSDVLTAARRFGEIAPDEFARVADELLGVARARGRLPELIDGARKSGTLDDMLRLGKLTPEEIDALEVAGKLSPLEAREARKAHAAVNGDEGLLIHAAAKTEKRYKNKQSRTCHPAALENGIRAQKAGYDVNVVIQKFDDGSKHAVIMASRDGVHRFMSWGDVFDNLDDLYPGRPYTIESFMALDEHIMSAGLHYGFMRPPPPFPGPSR
jgi:hypothetical protein